MMHTNTRYTIIGSGHGGQNQWPVGGVAVGLLAVAALPVESAGAVSGAVGVVWRAGGRVVRE